MKYLLLAAVLVAGCNDGEQITRADGGAATSELQDIGLDVRSGFLRLTFSSAEGETTVVLTPESATRAHLKLGQMLEQRLQTVEAPRAPSRTEGQQP